MIPASGSETSLKVQSSVGNKGLSIGPKTTDLGKHSLKTAVSPEMCECKQTVEMKCKQTKKAF